MAKYQKAKEEVESFLNDVKSIILNGKNIAILIMCHGAEIRLIRHWLIWQKHKLLKKILKK